VKLTIAVFGLTAAGVVALGQLSAAQWHAIGLTLVALALRYGLTVLPWLLAVLFALLWIRQRDITDAFREGYLDKVPHPIGKRTTGKRRTR
jgi:hypothetical protein